MITMNPLAACRREGGREGEVEGGREEGGREGEDEGGGRA